MKKTRYAKSRQKACLPCTKAKAKCDRVTIRCARCAQRDLDCIYSPDRRDFNQSKMNGSSNFLDDVEMTLSDLKTGASAPGDVDISSSSSNPSASDFNYFIPVGADEVDAKALIDNTHSKIIDDPRIRSGIDPLDSELICTINAQDISNRWLNAYAPMPGHITKTYPTNVAVFIYQMLKSYATVVVHGKGTPPIIHATQLGSLENNAPLSTCLSLTRACTKPSLGADDALAKILQQEMIHLQANSDQHNGKTVRNIFQVYLIYAMVLYFCLKGDSNAFIRQAMIHLQELACASSEYGVVCIGEKEGFRPSWEAWIAAESQRRTLYTMYLLDNLLSIQDGLPTFLGVELQGLPAPACRTLWHARTKEEWEIAYNAHLAEWNKGGLCIDDLWPAPESLNQIQRDERRDRINRWLENLDDFGIMLYAVTCCTHGL